MQPDTPLYRLMMALRQAKGRARLKPVERVRLEDREKGTGTNAPGPPATTDYPANAWPEDGDHS